MKNIISQLRISSDQTIENEEKRKATALKIVIFMSIILTTLLVAGSIIGNNVPARSIGIGVAWIGTLCIGWYALQRNATNHVAIALPIFFFVFLTSANASLGTIRTPTASAYVFWVILVGTLFKLPGVIVGTAASSIAIFGLIALENAGLLPQPNYSVGLTQWINYTTIFLLTASMVYFGNSMLEKALIKANAEIERRKKTESELQQAIAAAEQAGRELRIANNQLEKMATTDPLTGAWNRRHFLNVASHTKAQSDRYGKSMSIILIDIDHFKSINDTYGHQAGDSALITLTSLIQGVLREADFFARWGGEEFVVLTPNCRAEQAVQLAEKLRQLVESHTFGDIGNLTISLGVAELKSNESIDGLFKRVDLALYEAKTKGRNRVQAGDQ